jgi:transposase
MQTQNFFRQLKHEFGCFAYYPKVMLKIILYTYTQRVFLVEKLKFY